ncbi:glutamate synthase subunit beta [Demequina globuliformis]|uniref:glutamate synthase subunit beta n=1 Tax=Demequina globuliformis TaxID=676202 RepID=UPI0007806ADA|nr:glutamate synthase subunit beta [Demequina globuliformis]
MADPQGFLKYREREVPKSRPVPVRLLDWKDVKDELSKDEPTLRRQATRCMDCGIPFCHQGCPLGNIIPEWNDLVRQGQWEDAIERLHATNNFPDFTGRICPAPCETSCVLGINQPAVTIKNIEAEIIDRAFKDGTVRPHIPQRQTGKTIAVVGSGPAGLAAAQQLTRAGHTVRVYERDDRIGGLLRYGVPDFKLEKIHIERRIEQMEAEGTRFRTEVEIGKDITWEELRARYDAVLIATGSPIPRDLPLPGRDLDGIHYAMPYLHQGNLAAAGDPVDNQITAEGKHVIVIGGGDTGSDCIGTALRQKAASVTTLAIGKELPHGRPDHEPWPMDPRVFEVSSSHEEGGERHFLASTVEFLGDEAGQVRALRVAETQYNADGSRTPKAGTERDIPADLVLIAMGFTGPETEALSSQGGVAVTDRGRIERADDFHTSVDGVFVAGDASRGASLVVWAIAEGRSAAAAIDHYLTGSTELPAPVTASTVALRA